MRPVGSKKERLAIYASEYRDLINKLYLANMRTSTRQKLVLAFTLLHCTGCRVSEILHLTNGDLACIILNGTLALGANTKTRRPRTILFNEAMRKKVRDLVALLNINLAEAEKKLFFKNASKKQMSVAGFTQFLNAALAGLLGSNLYTSHSFRAGYVTAIVEATGNIKTAQDLVGHRSIKTTLNYLSTSTAQKMNALDKVFI